MNDQSAVRLDMFVRVDSFGRAHAADSSSTDAPQHLDNLGRIIAELGKAKAGQAHGSTEAKEVLLDALRLDVQNVSRTAAALAQDNPGFEKLFRAPTHSNPAAILTAADTIIANLVDTADDDANAKGVKAKRRARFIANGLPENFADLLVQDRNAIDIAQAEEHKADSEGVRNTALIGRLIGEGMKEIHYLDAIYHNIYTRNPEKMRAWLSASHVERVAHHKKDNGATPEPAVPESELTPESSPVPSK
ncbi:MAG TPA: hypothetical protein VL171_09190 [Verrucomicrobiae bacterium]|nr:hypothetical protein [Verrucomicrobiae bacterium]